MQVLLSRRAATDIEEILDYGARTFSICRSTRYVADLQSTLSRLASSPGIGAPLLSRDSLRRYPFKSHLIFYRESTTGITVIRVLHERRDWPSLLG